LAIKKAQEKDESQNEEDKLYSQLYGEARAAKKGKNKNIKFNDTGVKEYLNDLKVSATASAKIEVILKRISNKANVATEDLEEMKSVILEGGDPLKKLMAEDTSEVMQLIDNIQTGAEGSTEALRGFMSSLEMVARDAAGGELGKATLKDMEKYQQAVKQTTIHTDELSQSTKHLDEKAEGVTKTIAKAAKAQATWADKIVATASAILSLSEIFNIIGTLVETL
jgi:methyl-accepting chemotaxis protein